MGINRKIENLKNVTLVVLFVMAILLLYLLWRPALQEIRPDVFWTGALNQKEIPQPEDLIRPVYAAVSPGDGSFALYTKEAGAMLTAAEEEIRAFLEQGTSNTQVITENQYFLAMRDWESVQLEMGFSLPLTEFCSYFSGASLDNGAGDIRFDVLAFSKASAESIFAVDRNAGRYYRIVFLQKRDSAQTLMDLAQSPASYCYTAEDMLGKGRALISLALESSLRTQSFTPEAAGRGDQIAERIFGDTFDFVRRITDTYGNVTYMYGYGEKTFYAAADGHYVYNTDSEEREATGLFDDLKTAAESLVRWGGLDTGDLYPVLEDYSEIGSGRNRERTFYFTQTAGDARVYGDDIYCARVKVAGGTVTELSRNLSSARLSQEAVEPMPAADAANVIAANSNHIFNILNNNTLTAASDEAFAKAAEEAVTLVPGYYASDRYDALVPCWILKTGNGTRFYFDLYTATPMGFARKGA